MITTRPDVHLDGMYSISQAAAALQVDRSTLRRYAQKGLIAFKVRKTNLRKVVTGKQIIKCWESCYL